MDVAELMRSAAARGVATSYEASPGAAVIVPPETIEAILAALGDPPQVPLPDAGGLASLAAPVPDHRSWGLTIQLYALRSRASWGHGDFRDLADLASWSARDLGAGFVLINPLHAAEPVPPVSTSPYLPMSRRYVSPLYLRVEDIAEYSALDDRERRHLAALARPLRAANEAGALIDRDAVWAAKRAALKILHQVPMSPERSADFDAFREREGQALTNWATWCVLAEQYGPDWRVWPARLKRADSETVTMERGRAGPGG